MAHLIRSQAAGIIGNLALCAPLVLARAVAGLAAVRRAAGRHARRPSTCCTSLTLLGPTALFAAFTGVLLFASSLIAGWVENWFVCHRLDSAIAWNPRIVARLGAARAQRWSTWWRDNICGVAANVSLGMMLGLVPVVMAFFGLPLEVRHVTLSTGQLAAAVGALGLARCCTPRRSGGAWPASSATGVLNIGVSFWLAFKLAARSRGVRAADRSASRAALSRAAAPPPAQLPVADARANERFRAAARPSSGARPCGGRRTSSTRR